MAWLSEDADASLQTSPVCWADQRAEKGESLGSMDGFCRNDLLILVRTSIPSTPGCLFEAAGSGRGKKVMIDTSALDGLRGVAALHVAVGHYSGENFDTDLVGGQAMGLFYILSGFVMSF